MMGHDEGRAGRCQIMQIAINGNHEISPSFPRLDLASPSSCTVVVKDRSKSPLIRSLGKTLSITKRNKTSGRDVD
jgi:hypothetical protein